MTKEYNANGELLNIRNDYYVYLENELKRMFSNKDDALKYGKFLSNYNKGKNITVKEEERQIGLFYKF